MVYSYSIVLVTYNRLSFLKLSLEHALNQTMPAEHVIVVDNASTDGSWEYLKEKASVEPRIRLLREKQNVGGAGGFHDGIQEALKYTRSGWILVIDDDAVLDESCCEKLNPLRAQHKAAAYACTVRHGQQIDTDHRRDKRNKNIPVKRYQEKEFLCSYVSFCGALFSRKLIQEVGYPLKEYFIWFDDTEYSMRVAAKTPIVVITDAYLQHWDPREPLSVAPVDWKYYYGTRNHLDCLMRHRRYGEFLSFLIEVSLIVLLRRIKALVNCHERKKNLYEAELFSDSIKDALKCRLGINEKYSSENKKKI